MKPRILPAVLVLAALLMAAPAAQATRTAPSLDVLEAAEAPASLLSRPAPCPPPALPLLSPKDRAIAAALASLDEPDRTRLLALRRLRLTGPAAPLSRPEPLVWGQKTASRRFFWPGAPNLWETRLLNPALRQGGLFLELDPLGPIDSPNLYQAFGFDGLNVRDPFGLHEFRKVRIGDEEYQVAAPTSDELRAGDLTIHWSYQHHGRTVQVDVDQRSALTWALMAKEFPGSPWEASWEKFYGTSTKAIPGSALRLYWENLKTNAAPIALAVMGEVLGAGEAAGGARPGASSGAPRINLLNDEIPTNSTAAELTRSGLPTSGVSLGSASGESKLERLRQVRSAYNAHIPRWRRYAESMLERGTSKEHVARRLSLARRAAGVRYKRMTPWWDRMKIYYRNRAPVWFPRVRMPGGLESPKGYDSIYGPSVDWLRKRGYSWDEIIEKSLGTSEKINKALQ